MTWFTVSVAVSAPALGGIVGDHAAADTDTDTSSQRRADRVSLLGRLKRKTARRTCRPHPAVRVLRRAFRARRLASANCAPMRPAETAITIAWTDPISSTVNPSSSATPKYSSIHGEQPSAMAAARWTIRVTRGSSVGLRRADS
jgi:hypothetical protein